MRFCPPELCCVALFCRFFHLSILWRSLNFSTLCSPSRTYLSHSPPVRSNAHSRHLGYHRRGETQQHSPPGSAGRVLRSKHLATPSWRRDCERSQRQAVGRYRVQQHDSYLPTGRYVLEVGAWGQDCDWPGRPRFRGRVLCTKGTKALATHLD